MVQAWQRIARTRRWNRSYDRCNKNGPAAAAETPAKTSVRATARELLVQEQSQKRQLWATGHSRKRCMRVLRYRVEQYMLRLADVPGDWHELADPRRTLGCTARRVKVPQALQQAQAYRVG